MLLLARLCHQKKLKAARFLKKDVDSMVKRLFEKKMTAIAFLATWPFRACLTGISNLEKFLVANLRSPGGFIGWGDTNSWRNCFYMLHRGVYRSHIRAHLKMPFCIGCGHPYLKIVYPLALVGRKKIQLKGGRFTLLLLSFCIMHSWH